MAITSLNLCRSCVHLGEGGITCKAFPGGIPMAIVLFGEDHRTPVEGDGGVVYEMKPGQRQAFLDWQVARA